MKSIEPILRVSIFVHSPGCLIFGFDAFHEATSIVFATLITREALAFLCKDLIFQTTFFFFFFPDNSNWQVIFFNRTLSVTGCCRLVSFITRGAFEPTYLVALRQKPFVKFFLFLFLSFCVGFKYYLVLGWAGVFHDQSDAKIHVVLAHDVTRVMPFTDMSQSPY